MRIPDTNVRAGSTTHTDGNGALMLPRRHDGTDKDSINAYRPRPRVDKTSSSRSHFRIPILGLTYLRAIGFYSRRVVFAGVWKFVAIANAFIYSRRHLSSFCSYVISRRCIVRPPPKFVRPLSTFFFTPPSSLLPTS